MGHFYDRYDEDCLTQGRHEQLMLLERRNITYNNNDTKKFQIYYLPKLLNPCSCGACLARYTLIIARERNHCL